MNLFIFRRFVSSFGPFCSSISWVFSRPTSRETSHRSRNKRTSSAYFQNSFADFGGGCPYPLCTPNSTQGHPMSPKAEGISRGSQTQKCNNPASSRVRSLVWHSRPRLCVLNQISRGAQPPSAADTRAEANTAPQILAQLRPPPYLHDLHGQTKYESTLPSCLILSNRNSAAKRSTKGKKERFLKSREEA
jgi:hypothetical protein